MAYGTIANTYSDRKIGARADILLHNVWMSLLDTVSESMLIENWFETRFVSSAKLHIISAKICLYSLYYFIINRFNTLTTKNDIHTNDSHYYSRECKAEGRARLKHLCPRLSLNFKYIHIRIGLQTTTFWVGPPGSILKKLFLNKFFSMYTHFTTKFNSCNINIHILQQVSHTQPSSIHRSHTHGYHPVRAFGAVTDAQEAWPIWAFRVGSLGPYTTYIIYSIGFITPVTLSDKLQRPTEPIWTDAI